MRNSHAYPYRRAWCGVGPLEVMVIECPGDRFRSEIISALASAVDGDSMRIVDVTFVHKDALGDVSSYELAELDEHELIAYDVVDETRGLLSAGDIAKIGTSVSSNSSAILLVVEHVWTTRLDHAILAANGRMVLRERISPEIARAALDHGRCSMAADCARGKPCSDDG